MSGKTEDYNAWNPGFSSDIPAQLLPLVTLYRPENSTVSYAEAKEAADFCGRRPSEMNAFRASRLVRHELFIRLMADINVPDGPEYPELGEHLRGIAKTILDGYVQPKMSILEQEFERLRGRIEQRLAARLDQDIYGQDSGSGTSTVGLLERLGFRKLKSGDAEKLTEEPEIKALLQWQNEVYSSTDAFETGCLKGLLAIVGGIVGQRGRLFADRDLILKWATNWVCNDYGGQRIGQLIQPMIAEAARREGYRVLPFQSAPLFMSVKGGPGAGKSTLRPLQRELAARLGVAWEDFAKISPDYCRKFLLDYDSLGADFKYAAALTAQELEIIDKKIDRYMERKAAKSEMPHVLVDRFRFDSFMPAPYQKPGSTLLSRFADTAYLFFMITPPEATVERAWDRGLKTGRYKALDDMLHFNIEANVGMPQLFFNWVKRTNQKVHFEFLDNDVPLGAGPKTAAFGWNDKLTIVDPECLRNMDRYRRININAQRPEDVLLPEASSESDFLKKCMLQVPNVTFIDPKTAEVQAQTQNGICVYDQGGVFERLSLGAECKRLADRSNAAPALTDNSDVVVPVDVEAERRFTVGRWAEG